MTKVGWEMGNKLANIIAILVLAISPMPLAVLAEPIEAEFSGEITHVWGSMSSYFQVGGTLSGVYYFDSNAFDQSLDDPNRGIFRTSNLDICMTASLGYGGPMWTFRPGQGGCIYQTFDNIGHESASSQDQLAIRSRGPVDTSPVNGLSPIAVELGFTGSARFFEGDVVPEGRLSGFDYGNLTLDFSPDDTGGRVHAQIRFIPLVSAVAGQTLLEKLEREAERISDQPDAATEQSKPETTESERVDNDQTTMAQTEKPKFSLYGLEIGMSYDQALAALKSRYPNMDVTSDGAVLFGLGGPNPSTVIRTNSYHIQSKGIAAIGKARCAEDQIAENWDKNCVDRLVFAARLGDGEYHKVDLSFAEDYPKDPGEAILYDLIFSHDLGEKKPFAVRKFVEERYGPTQDTGWSYRVFFNTAIGEGRVTLSCCGNATDKYVPQAKYSIIMVSVTDKDRAFGIGGGGPSARGALGAKLWEIKELVREEKERKQQPTIDADDPF